jgi:hypothetical protein
MRSILTVLFSLLASSAFALTASWQPNTEPDMAGYNVYVCKVKGCAVQKDASQKVGTVQHPTVKWIFPADLVEGTLAVSAFDVSGNESGLSNQVPFDLAPPKVPAGIQVSK